MKKKIYLILFVILGLAGIAGFGIIKRHQYLDKILEESHLRDKLREEGVRVRVYSNLMDIVIPKEGYSNIYTNHALFLNYTKLDVEKNVVVVIDDIVYKDLNDIKIESKGDFQEISVGIHVTSDINYFYDGTLKKQFKVIIDKRLPVGKLINVNDEKFIFTWDENEVNSDKKMNAKLNGRIYKKGEEITESGNHQIILEDECGNKSFYDFKIENKNPKGILIGVENNGITNKNVSFYWEDNGKAFLNGEKYNKGKSIVQSGDYQLVYENSYKKRNIYNFKIDKIAPVGKFIKTVNYDNVDEIIFTWDKKETTAILNEEPYEKGNIIPIKNNDQIILKDLAGNEVIYHFNENDLPTGNFIFNYKYKKVFRISFDYDDTKMAALKNNSIYTKGNAIINGDIVFLTNKLGNITIYDSSQHYMEPNLEFSENLNHNLRTNGNFFVKWNNNISASFLNGEEYEKGTTITEEGFYEFTAKDIQGNKHIYNIMIDKTKPNGKITPSELGQEIKPLFTPSYDQEIYVTEDYVSFVFTKTTIYPGEEIKARKRTYSGFEQINTSYYHSNQLIDSEGFYEIILEDAIGNKTIYIIYIQKPRYNVGYVGYFNTRENGIYFDSKYDSGGYKYYVKIGYHQEKNFSNYYDTNILEYESDKILVLEMKYHFTSYYGVYYFEVKNEKIVIKYIERNDYSYFYWS